MNTIPLTPAKPSGLIKSHGYDPASKVLAVQFHDRSKTPKPPVAYHYEGVNQDLFERFTEAESLGTFFGVHFKTLPFTKHEIQPDAK